jgi:hypothetical protein
LESLFWLRETRCSYGEMTSAQLIRLGSRGSGKRNGSSPTSPTRDSLTTTFVISGDQPAHPSP